MAKMIAEFDTETKKLTASIDGSPIGDIRMVEIGPSWDEDDEFSCSFLTKTTDDSGITRVTRLYASETKKAKAALARKDGKAFPSKTFHGFVEDHSTSTLASKVHHDIAEAFGCKE